MGIFTKMLVVLMAATLAPVLVLGQSVTSIGASSLRRKGQATALVQFLNGTVLPAGTRHALSVGNYNANYEEDPMDLLRAAGLVVGSPASSTFYVFNGLSGALDHAVLTASLRDRTTVEKWHLSAAEPEFLEYAVAGPTTDTSSPFRSSDHDPVLIGLNFRGVATAPSHPNGYLQVFPNPAPGPFTVRIMGPPAAQPLTLEAVSELGQRVLTLHGTAEALAAETSRCTARLVPGTYLLHLRGPGFSQVQRAVEL